MNDKSFYHTIKSLQTGSVDGWKVARDILHVVFHCVFHHAFVKPPIDAYVWDLAADIAVENVINSLGDSLY